MLVYQRVSTQEISGTPPTKRWIWKISGIQPDPAIWGSNNAGKMAGKSTKFSRLLPSGKLT